MSFLAAEAICEEIDSREELKKIFEFVDKPS